jgi:hypothetical protein
MGSGSWDGLDITTRTTHLHLKMKLELFFHAPLCLHIVVLKQRTALYNYLYVIRGYDESITVRELYII